jgi:hypothetical protein
MQKTSKEVHLIKFYPNKKIMSTIKDHEQQNRNKNAI